MQRVTIIGNGGAGKSVTRSAYAQFFPTETVSSGLKLGQGFEFALWALVSPIFGVLLLMQPLTFQLLDPKSSDDVSTVAQLHCAAPLDWDPEHRYSNTQLEKIADRLSGNDGSINFVMLARNLTGNIVAFHWVQAKPGEDKPHAHVVGLWVQPEYRKQGIASRLKSEGEAWCLVQGITELRTNVYTVNQAMVELNQRLGFEVAMLGMVKQLSKHP